MSRGDRGGEIFDRANLGLRALRFTPGCHIAGFQPFEMPLILFILLAVLPFFGFSGHASNLSNPSLPGPACFVVGSGVMENIKLPAGSLDESTQASPTPVNPVLRANPLRGLPLEDQSRVAGLIDRHGMAVACRQAGSYYKLEDLTFEDVADFQSWYHLFRYLEQADHFVESLRQRPSSPADREEQEKLSQAAQTALEMRAVLEHDNELFLHLRKLRQRDRLVEFEARKIAVAEQRAQRIEEESRRQAAASQNRAKVETQSKSLPSVDQEKNKKSRIEVLQAK